MAEKENIDNDPDSENKNGGWWGSWLNTAKSKTSTVFEAVRKDLSELSTAVRAEASNVGVVIENTLRISEDDSAVGAVKKSISSFFGQVGDILVPSIDDELGGDFIITNESLSSLDGFAKHLAELQSNDKTYLEEPNKELLEAYERWLEVIGQEQFTRDRIAKQLSFSEILNEKYLILVPDKISHMKFWQRYLFKRALLEDAYANTQIAERRALEEKNAKTIQLSKESVNNSNDQCCEEKENLKIVTNEKSSETEDEPNFDDMNWPDEEIIAHSELTEEQQIKLLEQYEQEIQDRDKRRSIVLTEANHVDIIAPNIQNNDEQPDIVEKDNDNEQQNESLPDKISIKNKSKKNKNSGLNIKSNHFKNNDSSSSADKNLQRTT